MADKQIYELDEHTTIDNNDLVAVDVPVGGGLYETRYVSFANLLPANIINATRLGSNAVTTAKIADAQVTAAKMAADAARISSIVRKNGDKTISAASGEYLHDWSVLSDDTSIWSASDHGFKIKVPGTYAIYFNGALTAARNAGARIRHIRGATETWVADQDSTPSGVAATRLSVYGELPMLADEIVKIWMENNEGASTATLATSVAYQGATLYASFGIHRVD